MPQVTNSAVAPTSRSLQIVFVAPFGLRHKTTVWARTLPLAEQLVARGHRVTLLIPPWDSPADAGASETRVGVRLEQVSLRGGALGTAWRMRNRCQELSPDVIHIVKPRAHAGLVQWFLHHFPLPNSKVILDIDDWEVAWNAINNYGRLLGAFLAWQERWGICHAPAITAASRWLLARAGEMAPETPVLHLPNGLAPLTHATPPSRRTAGEPPRILFFSRFVETSPAWLAAFWRAVLAQLPHAELFIAGAPVAPHLEPPFRAALADVANVTWMGYVPGERISALYAGTDCAIFPADPVPLQQAKCSVRLATTLLHGVPVVASDVGEQASYAREAGAALVPAGATPDEFAAAVLSALAVSPPDPAIAASKLLGRFAWRDLAANLEAFYLERLAARPPHTQKERIR